jgi:hypothetical protein
MAGTWTVGMQPHVLEEADVSVGVEFADKALSELGGVVGRSRIEKYVEAAANLAYVIDNVLFREVTNPYFLGSNLAPVHQMRRGELAIVFSGLKGLERMAFATAWISAVIEARGRYKTPSIRQKRIRQIARHELWRDQTQDRQNHTLLIELAALVLDNRGIDDLAAPAKGIPLLAIVADTYASGLKPGLCVGFLTDVLVYPPQTLSIAGHA